MYLARYSQGDSGDTTAPGAVNDLRVMQVSSYSATLAWTAPGDDGAAGSAASYDLRYTVGVAIDNESAFESAVKAAGLPVPAVAGSAEKFVLTGLSAGGTYYFALKAADEAGNISGLSNSPKGTTLAAQKYKISISSFGWQIVAISTWSAPMGSLVTIMGTTLPVTGLGLDFSISTFPAGATGQELSKSSETTSAGLADVLLKLGNIPAEYGVTATCRDCEASASTVTFTCCGKLPNDDFKQGDLKWNTTYYDNICSTTPAYSGYRPVVSCDDSIFKTKTKYHFTIQSKGCGLSSLATVINYFVSSANLSISSTTPFALNSWLSKNKGYDMVKGGEGSVVFAKIRTYSQGNIEFAGRKDICSDLTACDPVITTEDLTGDIDTELKNERPVIVRVPGHFMVITGRCQDKYIVSDPGSTHTGLYNPKGDRPLVGIRLFSLVSGK